MGKLDGRVAIVTGGAQGIGKAIVDKLADEGATVVVADVNGERAEQAAPEGGAGMRVDVSQESEVARMVEEAVSRFGKLDVLVNNAAIVPFTPWDEVSFDDWRQIMAVNLDGMFHTCRQAEKPMREASYGRIVNVSSNVVLAGTPNLAHYVASKGAVFAFTRALANEVGKHGITVNSLAPRLAATEGVRGQTPAEMIEYQHRIRPLGRDETPEDLEGPLVFLASDASDFMTGQMVLVNGGAQFW